MPRIDRAACRRTSLALAGEAAFVRWRAALLFAFAVVCAASPGDVGYAADDSPATVQVSLNFVATREKNSAGAEASRYLGDGRGPTTYGRCIVEHGVGEARNRLDGLVEFLLPVNRGRIVAVEERRPAAFWRGLEKSLAGDPSRRVVLFVHGYSYGFDRGCRRVSAFQRALGDDARMILFSWPSNGNPLDYADDRADLEWSVPEIARLVNELSERFGAARIALAAHSMGSAGILAALERLRESDVNGPVAADLVLLAPDYGIDDFMNKRELLNRMVGQTTVYVSENDRLLGLSAWHNDEPRLGEGGENLAVAPFFETIDVTPVGRYHPTGHEYHVFHPVVEADLVELLTSGEAAASRKRPVPIRDDGEHYWKLAPVRPRENRDPP